MNAKMLYALLITITFPYCVLAQHDTRKFKNRAELLFRSVYEGNMEKIDQLISDDIILSYPIFEEIFNKNVISGKEAYKQYAIGFNSRWKDCHVVIHETVGEEDKVVLLWSFNAKRIDENDKNTNADQEQHWGGITFFRFDKSGKINEEIGEESSPGPYGRIK